MIEFAAEEEEDSPGSPAWMATFADLMSLLMTFFVLLLSFSEMDVQKYKLVAGSMKNAFGIQQEVVATKNPSGSEALLENYLQEAPTVDSSEVKKADMLKMLEQLMAETAVDIEKLEEVLKEEIQGGFIDLESGFRSITIRIKEKGSFDSGSADLQLEFVPVMAKLRNVLVEIEGKITVEGHTDDVYISTVRFASNWALSSARALSVGHELLREDILDSDRFVISGFSDTVPYADNETPEGRASNRRVEIIIRQPISAEIGTELRAMSGSDEELQKLLNGIGIGIDEILVE